MNKTAYIFDLDGLLIDSEPMWQKVEQQVFATVGIELTTAMCEQTTGVQIKDVVEFWYQRFPWQNRTKAQVYDDIIAGMVAGFATDLVVKPGAVELITKLAVERKATIAICSASPMVLIDAAVKQMEVGEYIKAKHSAEFDEFGKPHPLPYLKCAKAIGDEPRECVVFEDSVTGAIAGKAAGMYVVAVPDGPYSAEKFAFCDEVITSLTDF
jgi:sugar-phosphatase